MKGILYLRSYYDMNDLPNDVVKINIARGNMQGVDNKIIELAPSKELFNWFQINKNKDNWFADYRKVYLNQLKNNKVALNNLSDIKKMLESGSDVCLLCFCRKQELCHRSLIGKMFESKGFEVNYK